MLKAFATLDVSTHLFKVHFTMKLTYRTLPYDDDDNDVDIQGADADITESGGTPSGDTRNKAQWDDDCPWRFELIALWSEKWFENSLEMAELENASPHEAEKWIVFPNLSSHLVDDLRENTMGFSSQLHLLVNALDMSFEAQFMEDFCIRISLLYSSFWFEAVEKSGSDNLKSSMVIPPPTVLDRVLKDLFHDGVESPDLTKAEHKSSRAIKGAPLGSLFAQFCLHSLWFGNCNIRAIASLWIEFVREVRWCWEESQPLPHMAASGVIDLSTCLINQKLKMVVIVQLFQST
ncbi:hypothetical protein CK203_008230 [Vitis vinifera]|uniref:Uncharacterized protein n=1 Tax=Vitis vinifera TaxID=29760 RepID=A0A438KNH7_VITVI|nr:hypothetical protein CK203_008230 [Vitis vinifera]